MHLRTFASLGSLFALVACVPDEQKPLDASCEAVADQEEALCGPISGALEAAHIREFHCEALKGHLISDSARMCILSAKTCTELAERDCGVNHLILACHDSVGCPPPLRCDDARGECVRCMTDDDCDPFDACSEGLCLKRSSLAYTAGPENTAHCQEMCPAQDPMDCKDETSMCVAKCTGVWDYPRCNAEYLAFAQCAIQASSALECDSSAPTLLNKCGSLQSQYLNCSLYR